MVVKDQYAYIVSRDSLHVMDLSSPTQPAQIGVYQTWDSLVGITLAGNYAYLVSDEGSLGGYRSVQVVDISNPAQPAAANRLPAGLAADEVIVSDASGRRYAYRPTPWMGLRVVDVTDPLAPVGVGLNVDTLAILKNKQLLYTHKDYQIYLKAGFGPDGPLPEPEVRR